MSREPSSPPRPLSAVVPVHRSLRGKLAALVAFLLLAALGVSTTLGVLWTFEFSDEQVRERLRLEATLRRQVVEDHVRHRRQLVALIATRTRLRVLLQQRLDEPDERASFLADTTRILEDARRSSPDFLAVSVTDPAGVIVTSTRASLVGTSCASSPEFQAGRQGSHLGLPRAGEQGATATLAAAAHGADERFLGVVLVEIDAEPLRRSLDSPSLSSPSPEVVAAAPTGDGRLRYLFPPSGQSAEEATLESDEATAGALAGARGLARSRNARGREVLVAREPIEGTDWVLVVMVDEEEALGPARASSRRVIWTGAALALGGLVVTALLARRLTNSLRRLSSTAQRFAAGDGAVRFGTSSRDEVGLLSRTLDEMRVSLEEHRVHLEELVQERTAELESANQAKGEFLAHMSHEIRTPLHAILGLTELCLEAAHDEPIRERLTLVLDSAGALMVLIDDVLDFSRIEARKVVLHDEAFDLHDLLRRTVEAQSLRARTKGLHLHWTIAEGTPRQLVGDPHRLRQILTNLIGNALKFTSEGEVRVQAEQLESGDDGALRLGFEVRDTGPGIPAEDRERIFEPFERLDSSSTREHAGTGLGLAISRRLVTSMRGTIRVDSARGSGSRFRFDVWLERDEGERHDARDASESPAALPPLRILVAEDSPPARVLMQGLLESWGHRSTVVDDGRAAVEAHARDHFDVVLMDLEMPVMDGLEATELIRRRDRGRGRHTPIVMMTAHALPGDRERVLSAGVDNYLPKPIRRPDLVRALSSVLAAAPRGARGEEIPSSPAEPIPERALPSEGTDANGSPALDWKRALQQTGGNEALLCRVLASFAEEAPAQLERIDRAQRSGRAEELRIAAHRLQGELRLLGSPPARPLAAELERAAEEGRLDDASKLIPRLHSALQASLDEVARRLDLRSS